MQQMYETRIELNACVHCRFHEKQGEKEKWGPHLMWAFLSSVTRDTGGGGDFKKNA